MLTVIEQAKSAKEEKRTRVPVTAVTAVDRTGQNDKNLESSKENCQ